MIRQVFCLTLMIVFMDSVGWAYEVDSAWHFTSSEIDAAYRYQERFGQRLQHPAKPNDCYHGKKEFTASLQGKEFLAPCEFLTQTIRHLKQMLENGAARYLFALDADHAHLAVPVELWGEKYSNLGADRLLPELLSETRLIALYHTAEHLTGMESGPSQGWRAKRNILGFFDGRPLKILPPLPDGLAHDIPERYLNIGTISFLAHRLGAIVFSANGKAVPLDISFDEDLQVDAR